MTRIAIDADVLGRHRTGDETYIASLLQELAGAPEEIFAVTRHPDLVPSGIEPVELPARNQIVRMTLSFPRLLRRLDPDLAHFLYAIPPGYRGRSVVTVHDLSFEHLSDVMGFKDRMLFRTQVPRSVRRADRVLTGSEWTKRDLIERYDLAAERIVVTPYGVDPVYRPEGARADGHYALFVGAIQPRKDPLNALEALALINGDLKLVLIGPDKLGADRVRQAVERLGLQQRVEWKGHVEKDRARGSLSRRRHARLPVEVRGLRAARRRGDGVRDAGGRDDRGRDSGGGRDAAVLVEPGDPVALAGGIERALADRERLVAAGLERARRYTWAETARLTLEVYRELT